MKRKWYHLGEVEVRIFCFIHLLHIKEPTSSLPFKYRGIPPKGVKQDDVDSHYRWRWRGTRGLCVLQVGTMHSNVDFSLPQWDLASIKCMHRNEFLMNLVILKGPFICQADPKEIQLSEALEKALLLSTLITAGAVTPQNEMIYAAGRWLAAGQQGNFLLQEFLSWPFLTLHPADWNLKVKWMPFYESLHFPTLHWA